LRSARWFSSFSLAAFTSLSAFGALVTPRTAHAQLPAPEALSIAKVKGWELTLDGRVSAFLSFSQGDPQPPTTALWQGYQDKPDASGHIVATRVRSGFVSNVLGWTVRKDVAPNTTLSARLAIWGNISQQRDKTVTPDVDFREAYWKLEGPWGAVLAGRNIGVYGRGGINLDYDIEHGYGLGSPCMIVNREPGHGPIAACGHVGFGILFPAFNAQLTYNTPELAGFQLTVGLFDPAAITARSYERTPLPRVEGELTYKAGKVFHAEVSAMWQRIGQNDATLNLNVDAIGFAYSAGLNLGPVQVGGAGFFGQGLGIWSAMEDYPVFSDEKFLLRHQKGFLGMAALNFGHTKIAGGVGETLVSTTANDPTTPFTSLNFPRTQLGISAGVYQGVFENLVLGIDYFRGSTTYNHALDNSGNEFTPKQTVNFVNVGGTVVF
jgi:hypothetical protein